MRSHTSEELYLLAVLVSRGDDEALDVRKRLEEGKLRLVKSPSALDRAGTAFFFLLSVSVVAFVLALAVGLAKNLLQLVW